MELKISELDTMNPYETFNYNSYQEDNGNNYWEKTKIETKKKKVSFNDILSNMNLVVNNQGVLQFMVPTPQQEESSDNKYYNANGIENVNNKISKNPLIHNNNPEPLDQTVKHSYIYNKYFKDYVDPNAQKQGPRVPKTMEEYRKMLLEDRIKAIEHRKMIEQIKSKKMLFTTTPGMGINPRDIKPTKNNLRRLNFS
jgi:hypothetical protein